VNRIDKLLYHTSIFILGNLGSKLIAFFMVPLYTTVLSTDQYGTVDLLNATVMLVLPVITLAVGQGIARFVVGENKQAEKSTVLTAVFVINILAICASVIFWPFLTHLAFLKGMLPFFYLMLILGIFNETIANFIRAIGLVKTYALSGILQTMLLVTFNLLFLLTFKWALIGYLMASILATTLTLLYLIYQGRLWRYIDFKLPWRLKARELIQYSAPIIPNTIMWWLMNDTTRYCLLIFVGLKANGIFGVANKIPMLLAMFVGIFSQAWQLSAFEESKAQDKGEYYSQIFEKMQMMLFIVGSGVLVVTLPLAQFLFRGTFITAWQSVPALLIAVIYQSLAVFLGTHYAVAKVTKRIFATTIYTGALALLLNIILIPLFGLPAAGIATALSFVTLFALRIYDTQKYVTTHVNWPLFLGNNTIILVQTGVLFLLWQRMILVVVIETLIFLSLCWVNRKSILQMGLYLLGKIEKRSS
jgi:O-antigen/teichoic acid export membrane protein